MLFLFMLYLSKIWPAIKEKYLEANQKARTAIYKAKFKVERKKKSETLYGGIIRKVICLRLQRDRPKLIIVIGKQCIRNDDVVLVASDVDRKIALESYHGKFLNIKIVWNKKSLSHAVHLT